jgi:hypothetical protein
MSFYKTIEELDDKGIKKELKIWHYMYTIECSICNKIILRTEVIEYNKEFIGKICKSCSEREENDVTSETESRIKRIQKICERAEVEVMKGEILRMISMRYTDREILDWNFIKLFQENKNELEKVIREILDEYLRKRIEKDDEIEENSDNLEKIGEILSPEEHEIWEENTKDFNENEFENENENVINTEGFSLSQNSDSNNSLNIEDSDTKSENELLNMANQDQIKRIIENALGLTANALDHALGAG